jgi:hypothetical protein
MPVSGIAFVRFGAELQHRSPLLNDENKRREQMCIERIVRNLAFALVAIGIVSVLGAMMESEALKFVLAQ